MAADNVERAAERLRENLDIARRDGYYRSGWYSYMARWNVEALIDHVLGPPVTTSYLTLIPEKEQR